MENKHVGIIISGIALVMAFMVLIFNMGLKKIVQDTCTHGSTCSMYDTITVQTWISFSLAMIILIVGIVVMTIKPKEKIIIKKIKEKKKLLNLKGLEKAEKEVIELLRKEGNAMFQADLMEKMEMGKVKTTRLLDKLEAKQLIERKRRGMNNLVVIKEQE